MPSKSSNKNSKIKVKAHTTHRESQETEPTHAQPEQYEESASHAPDSSRATTEVAEPTPLQFPYSDLIRTYAPKAMDVADKVATDWKANGSFMNLGIENPYANMAMSLGLKKAKEIEKKLDEKGVLSAVRMGVEVIKQQVNRRK